MNHRHDETALRVMHAHNAAVLDRLVEVAGITTQQMFEAEERANKDGYSLDALFELAELDEDGAA